MKRIYVPNLFSLKLMYLDQPKQVSDYRPKRKSIDNPEQSRIIQTQFLSFDTQSNRPSEEHVLGVGITMLLALTSTEMATYAWRSIV